MPAGPGALGFAYFAAIKFAGYSAYGYAINRTKSVGSSTLTKPHPSWVGCVRTCIGVAVGTIVGFGYWTFTKNFVPWDGAVGFFALLVPIRVLEWYLLLTLLYKKFGLTTSQTTTLIAGGILASFALDVAGVAAAFILPGGAWIC